MLNPLLCDLLGRSDVHEALGAVQTMGGGKSLFDVNLTFVIALVFFLVTWGALKALLFDPYLKVKDARDQGTTGNREEANAMRAEADAKMASYKEAMAQARAEASTSREALKAEALAEEERIVGEATSATSARLSTHRADLAGQVERARGELKEQASSLSSAIVERLLPTN